MSKQNATNLQPSKPQENEAPANAGPALPENPLERLAVLLANEKVDSDPAPTATAAKPKSKPKDLAELAAALGVEPADVYNVAVPSAREGAEPFTIGKLKDMAADHDRVALRELEIEQQRRSKDIEYMRAEQELQAILATLPPDAIKPEAREKLKAKRDKALSQERQRVLDAIPEWRDADTRAQELEQIAEHLKDYGFPDTYLTSVFDHRTLRYIRENWRREKQIRAALEKVAERKPTTPPKAKAAGHAPPRKSANGQITREQREHAQFGNLITRS